MKGSSHLSTSTIGMRVKDTIQKHKLLMGEVRVDLRDYLPSGQNFWHPATVDRIVSRLNKERVASHISHEVSRRSHPDYDVLVFTPFDQDDDEFEADVRQVVTAVIEHM